MAASVKSRRACGPSFVFLAKARSWDALKSPRNDTGIAMTNLHRSPPMNQSKTDLGIVNESQLLRFGIKCGKHPRDRARAGIAILRQQARMLLSKMKDDRAGLEQRERTFLIGGDLAEGMD